jgi:transmembrane sensor
LKYDSNFGKKRREVFLEGEAWFDVKHDKKKPFIVHTQENDITVLGTSFNVYAYPSENTFRTSLERGKISVSHSDIETVKLKENQTYLLTKNSLKPEICESENIQSYSSWKEGETVFRNQPFSEILRNLERTHNVAFNLLNKEVGSIKFTGNFSTKDNISTILEVIKLPMAFEYVIVNDTITIK